MLNATKLFRILRFMHFFDGDLWEREQVQIPRIWVSGSGTVSPLSDHLIEDRPAYTPANSLTHIKNGKLSGKCCLGGGDCRVNRWEAI